MIFLQRHPRLGPALFGAILLLCATFAHGSAAACSTSAGGSGKCFVDCRNGSNSAPGTFDQPWRTPLAVGNHTFTGGDGIYMHRDCAWNSGMVLTSSGSSGNNIAVDSYGGYNSQPFASGPGTGAPPRLTGALPIAGVKQWCKGTWAAANPPVCTVNPASNIWVSLPLFDAAGGSATTDGCAGDHGYCIPCPSAGIVYSCLDQALNVLNFVRFGTVWGNDQEAAVAAGSISSALTQDRDWYFDTSLAAADAQRQSLYVYCTCTGSVTPDVYYGQVVPIAVSNEDSPVNGGSNMLNLNGVSYVTVQHLLLEWYDSIGVLVQGASDHIWLANIAAHSEIENAQYRSNGNLRTLCIPSNAYSGNCSLTGALSLPVLTVTPTCGSSCSATWSYEIVGLDSLGGAVASTVVSTSAQNATLSSSNKNVLTWTAASETAGETAATYTVYRTAHGTSPATNGVIASGLTALTFTDTGAAGNGSGAPAASSNTTGASQYTQIGFWMEPTGTPTDIHLFNVDSHMNYVGFKFGVGLTGGAGGRPGQKYELKNCRAYANRTYGITDDTNGGVTHDYCHFYGNNLATAVETDFNTDCAAAASGGCTGVTSTQGYVVPTCASHDVGCPPKIQGVFPPVTSGEANYTAYNTYVLTQPNVAGVTVIIPWNSIESNSTPSCSTGGVCSTYNFSTWDTNLAHFVTAGKIVNLIFSPVTGGTGPNSATPTYVFNTTWESLVGAGTPQDVAYCSNYPGSGAVTNGSANILSGTFDNTGMPVVTETPFTTAWENFQAAAVTHYSTPGGGIPPIGYIRFGATKGGEALAACHQYWPGYTKTVFLNYIQALMTFQAGLNPPMTLLADFNIDNSTNDLGYADSEAQYAVANGKMGVHTGGWQESDVSSFPNCASDWCNIFGAYGGQSTLNGGSPITLSLQTLLTSDPTRTLATGSLLDLLPLARSQGVNNAEIYPCDMLLAYDPNYVADSAASGCNSSFSTYAGAYAAALAAFVAPGGSGVHPQIQNWKRWPAYVTLTYDDPGLVQYSDTYLGQILPLVSAKLGSPSPFSIAAVTGGTYSQNNSNGGSEVSLLQSWIASGFDVNTHSVSHQYWKPPSSTACSDTAGPIPCDAFKIQYVGTSASFTMTVTHSGALGTLTLNGSPYDAACYHSWDLTPIAPGATGSSGQINTIGIIIATLQAQPSCYTIGAVALNNIFTKGNAHAYSLANVAGQDIKTSQYSVLFDETNLETDEMGWANAWMNHYLTGLPANRVYVMPGTYGDSITEGVAAAQGYAAVRGTGSMKPCCGASTTLANGYDKFNILSQGVNPNLQNLSYAQMRRFMQADLFKNALWGRPIGFFWHINELPPDQVENMFDALKLGGATLVSNTGLLTTLLNAPLAGHVPVSGQCVSNDMLPPVGVGDTGTAYVSGSFYACPSTGAEADWRETVNSPTVGVGVNLGSSYQYDIRGNNRNTFGTGWDLGALQYVPMSVGTLKHP